MLPGLNELAVTESSQLLPTIQNLDAFVSQDCRRMGNFNLRTSSDRDRDKTAKFRKLCLQGLSKLVRILSFQGLQVWLENYERQPDQNHSKKSLILATLRRPTQNSTVNQSLGPRKTQQTLKGN